MGVRGCQGYRWKDLGELCEASGCPTEASQTANFESARQLWASAAAGVNGRHKQTLPVEARRRLRTHALVSRVHVSRVFISHDAQHSISLYCTAALRLHTALSCWKLSQLARLACHYTWLLFGFGASAAAHKVEPRVRRLQGAGLPWCDRQPLHAAAAGRASCRGGLVRSCFVCPPASS